MTGPDHRALAEELIGGINAQLAEITSGGDPKLLNDPGVVSSLQICLSLAQVHATLAAGTPIADRHLLDAGASAAGKYRALRQAVHAYVANVEDGSLFARMLELAGGAR